MTEYIVSMKITHTCDAAIKANTKQEAVELAKRYHRLLQKKGDLYLEGIRATARPAREHDFWNGVSPLTEEQLQKMEQEGQE